MSEIIYLYGSFYLTSLAFLLLLFLNSFLSFEQNKQEGNKKKTMRKVAKQKENSL